MVEDQNKQLMKMELERINREFAESMNTYRKTMTFILGDAPIESLCLPKVTENILIDNGCLRIYDLFNRDLAKIEGLGVSRIRDLTTRLNEFFAMS